MEQHKNVVRLSEVGLEAISAPDGSAFGGKRQRVGATIGAKKIGYSVYTVAPGKAAFPYHSHYTNEEMIYIFDGEGMLRMGNEQIKISAGMFVAFPPGTECAHQLVNTGDDDLRYLCVSTMEYPDLTEYPDSGKIGALATRANEPGFRAFFRKEANVGYYLGENGHEIERIRKVSR